MNRTEKENLILRTLKNSKTPLTLKEIQSKVDMLRAEIKYLLGEMWSQGLIDWHGKYYRYADKLRKMEQIAQ